MRLYVAAGLPPLSVAQGIEAGWPGLQARFTKARPEGCAQLGNTDIYGYVLWYPEQVTHHDRRLKTSSSRSQFQRRISVQTR